MGALVERQVESPPTNRPEIGGSFGGFIAVVVTLAAVFVLSCIGIFFLVRKHESTSYGRGGTRNREFGTDGAIRPPSIRERIARLFGRRSGWIKASGGDGDEWDASDDPYSHVASELRRHGEYPASIASSAVGRPRRMPASNASMDSVEVELRAPSFLAPSYSHQVLHDGGEHEPVLAIGTTDRRVATPVSTALRESPPSLLSPLEGDRGEDYEENGERRFSVQTPSTRTGSASIRSMRKFGNGTKFKEVLDF